MHHDEYRAAGIALACVTREAPRANRAWSERLHLTYPLLADEDGALGRPLEVIRPLRFGPWTVELTRRTTLLVDAAGTIAAVWERMKVRNHALEVLRFARVARDVTGPGAPA